MRQMHTDDGDDDVDGDATAHSANFHLLDLYICSKDANADDGNDDDHDDDGNFDPSA